MVVSGRGRTRYSGGDRVCRGNAFVQGYGNGCSYMAGSRSFGRFGTYRREKPAHVFALRFVVGCRACGAESATGRVADFSGRRLRDGCRGNVDACAGMARGIVAVSDRSRPGRSDRGGKNFGRRIAAEFRHGGRAGSLGFAVRPAGSRGRVCRFFPAGPFAESVVGPVADRRGLWVTDSVERTFFRPSGRHAAFRRGTDGRARYGNDPQGLFPAERYRYGEADADLGQGPVHLYAKTIGTVCRFEFRRGGTNGPLVRTDKRDAR